MRTPEEPLDASGFRFAVAVAEFNHEITERLLEGTRKCFAEHGVPAEAVDVHWVPGSFELPLAVQRLAGTRAYHAIVALGCVVRGETPHFDYLAQATAYGLQRVALDAGVPVAFGVLTTDDFAQAEARAGGERGNKGWDAARTAIEMAALAADPTVPAAPRTRKR